MTACYACGARGDPGGKIYRNTVCESCGAELHCCKNCRFYEPGAHWDCRETITEPVREKERANFCDLFQPASPSDKSRHPRSSGSGRNAFDALFGDA